MARTPKGTDVRQSLKLAGYLRVSTDRQAEQGLGLEVQEQAIRAWAKANGHRITTWARDEGVSGSNGVATRIGLLDAFDAIKGREVAGLVVYRLDRLARDLIVQEQLLAEVKRMGGQVFSTSEAEAGYLDDDPDDPSRKLIRQVLGAVSEYERAMISLRLRNGRRRKAEKGGFAYGAPALGYRAEGGALVEVAEELAVVERVRELVGAGESLRSIAEKLTAEGHRTKRGGQWHPETLRRIVARL